MDVNAMLRPNMSLSLIVAALLGTILAGLFMLSSLTSLLRVFLTG